MRGCYDLAFLLSTTRYHGLNGKNGRDVLILADDRDNQINCDRLVEAAYCAICTECVQRGCGIVFAGIVN